MRAKTMVYSLIGLLGLGCCQKQQPDASSTAEIVWKMPLADRLTSSMKPIIYKQLVIYSAYDSSNLKHKVIAFNKETGQKVWEWKNTSFSVGYIDDNDNYVKGNILVLRLSGNIYQVVAINLDNGSELWHTRLPEAGTWQMVGVGEQVFHVRGNLDRMKDEIFVANVNTGHWQSVYAAVNTNAPIFIDGMRCYKGSDSKNYLAFLVAQYKDFNFSEVESTLFKYSLDSNKMVYQKKLDFTRKNQRVTLASATPDKFWLEGAPVYALSESNSEKLFEINLPAPEVLSGNISVINDKVFMPRTQTLLCFDAVMGTQLWQEDGHSSGLTKCFRVYQGKLYFASGTLHAFDVSTGKRIWNIISPDAKQDSAGFDGIVTIDSANNRLYTATYLNAICYKTAN